MMSHDYEKTPICTLRPRGGSSPDVRVPLYAAADEFDRGIPDSGPPTERAVRRVVDRELTKQRIVGQSSPDLSCEVQHCYETAGVASWRPPSSHAKRPSLSPRQAREMLPSSWLEDVQDDLKETRLCPKRRFSTSSSRR